MNTRYFFKITLLLCGVMFVFSSCRKDYAINPNITEYETDLQQFEVVWSGINTAYVLWPIDTTDWDAIYDKYYPVFKEMDNKPDSVWKAAWNELTSTLIDHHMNMYINRKNSSAFISLAIGKTEVESRAYYHTPLTPQQRIHSLNNLIDQGLLYNVVVDSINNLKRYFSGIIDNNIVYMYASSFMDITLCELNTFKNFKQLVANDNTKAVIIDVRDNVGGSNNNLIDLISCFTTEKVQIGYSQTKLGLDRYDLTPKMNDVLTPRPDSQNKNVPIIVLTNINSASCSEITAIAVRQLPQGYVVGERTFGATCGYNENFEILQSGPFGEGDVHYSSSHYVLTAKYLFTGVDGTVYEGHGVDPDVECLFDQSAWNNGIDNQLECAIEFAKNKIDENINK